MTIAAKTIKLEEIRQKILAKEDTFKGYQHGI